jgi:hypothetical protein
MGKGLKEKFLRVYANVPLGVRQEIIAVLDDGRPITWDVAFIEVQEDTKISEQILRKLERVQII